MAAHPFRDEALGGRDGGSVVGVVGVVGDEGGGVLVVVLLMLLVQFVALFSAAVVGA